MEDYSILIAIVVVIYLGYGIQEYLTPKIGPIYATATVISGIASLFGLTWLFSSIVTL